MESRYLLERRQKMLKKKYEPPAEKKKKPIAKESEKRKGEIKEFRPVRKDFLKKHPFCEICPKIMEYKRYYGGQANWWPKCGKKSVEIHHKGGRENRKLVKLEDFLASCDSKGGKPNGHRWLKEFPKQAEEIGIIVSRVKTR